MASGPSIPTPYYQNLTGAFNDPWKPTNYKKWSHGKFAHSVATFFFIDLITVAQPIDEEA